MMSTISSLLQETAYVATSVVMLIIIYFIDWKIGIGVTIISGLSLFLFKVQLNKSKNIYMMNLNIVDDVFHRIIEHDFGISEFTANMKRIKTLLEDDRLEKEKFGKDSYKVVNGNIEFKNVSFKYNENNRKVLDNISFSMQSKEKNAIIGMSGEGKTTIFKLLLKQYDDYEGTILIDGHDIQSLSEKSLRNAITIVNQEPMLFNMSIKNNLLMVNSKASEDEIKEACRLANIDEFIETLPGKYDEIIEENNNNLSVGQKQRLAIARAILKDTPIILFDEVTSSLDKNSKKQIEKAIEEISKIKTIVVIAHTLDSVENFDNIIVIKEGEISEQGSHAELLGQKGLYYSLMNL